ALVRAGRLHRDDADERVVEAQIEKRVVELAKRADRPGVRARLGELVGRLGLLALRRADGERRGARVLHDLERDVLLVAERRPRARLVPLALAARGHRLGAALQGLVELRLRRRLVHEPPLDGALAAHALGDGREDVRQIAPDLALVDEARETAGAGEDAEERG